MEQPDFWTDPLDVAPLGDAPPVDEQIRELGRTLALGSSEAAPGTPDGGGANTDPE